MISHADAPPLHAQVAAKIEKLIRSGALQAGERIPSVRRSSEQHAVSVTTVVQAYLAHDGSRPRTAQSYDRAGRVLLCSSFSKTLAPGYRVGWVAPGRYFEKVKALKLTSTLATATLPQLAIAEFLANGGYDHHLRALRRHFADQIGRMSAAVTAAFPEGVRLTRPRGGFVLWAGLPEGVCALRLHERALTAKISIAPGPMFSVRRGFPNFIRLNCGHAWSEKLGRAVKTLGDWVKTMD